MAPVCFVIMSCVKRRSGRNGGSQTTAKETGQERKEERKRTDIQTDRMKSVEESGRMRIQKRRD